MHHTALKALIEPSIFENLILKNFRENNFEYKPMYVRYHSFYLHEHGIILKVT